MTEPAIANWDASDGYPIHVATWLPNGPTRGHLVVLHGVQSHGGWYKGLGRRLAGSGFATHFPDRRGSGGNRRDRGHTPSDRRLVADVAEYLGMLRASDPHR